MQAESWLERWKLSFVLVKTAHILRLDRSYMLEEGLQSLATRCSYSCITALFCQTLHSHVSLSQHVCLQTCRNALRSESMLLSERRRTFKGSFKRPQQCRPEWWLEETWVSERRRDDHKFCEKLWLLCDLPLLIASRYFQSISADGRWGRSKVKRACGRDSPRKLQHFRPKLVKTSKSGVSNICSWASVTCLPCCFNASLAMFCRSHVACLLLAAAHCHLWVPLSHLGLPCFWLFGCSEQVLRTLLFLLRSPSLMKHRSNRWQLIHSSLLRCKEVFQGWSRTTRRWSEIAAGGSRCDAGAWLPCFEVVIVKKKQVPRMFNFCLCSGEVYSLPDQRDRVLLASIDL